MSKLKPLRVGERIILTASLSVVDSKGETVILRSNDGVIEVTSIRQFTLRNQDIRYEDIRFKTGGVDYFRGAVRLSERQDYKVYTPNAILHPGDIISNCNGNWDFYGHGINTIPVGSTMEILSYSSYDRDSDSILYYDLLVKYQGQTLSRKVVRICFKSFQYLDGQGPSSSENSKPTSKGEHMNGIIQSTTSAVAESHRCAKLGLKDAAATATVNQISEGLNAAAIAAGVPKDVLENPFVRGILNVYVVPSSIRVVGDQIGGGTQDNAHKLAAHASRGGVSGPVAEALNVFLGHCREAIVEGIS